MTRSKGCASRGGRGAARGRRGTIVLPLAAASVALALALALGACGSDSDGGPGPEPGTPGLAELLLYLPPDAPRASFVDVASTRSQLGLPADADPLDVAALEAGADLEDPRVRLLDTVTYAFPPLAAYSERFELPPSVEAFDGGQIYGIATAGAGPETITTVSTSQPFEEIRDALEERGFEPQGEAVVAGGDAESDPVQSVAQAEDGTIVLAGQSDLAARAAAEPAELAGTPALLAGISGSTLVAVGGLPDSCVRGFGVGTGPVGLSGDGVLVLALSEDPDPERFEAPDGASAPLDFEAPQVEEQELFVPFTAEPLPAGLGTSPGLNLVATLAPLSAYRCR